MASRIIALVGPTASGKSAAAVVAAERVGAEIVAVDAFTVYRGMDVGTAKPSADDRARITHHMIDVLEPEQECTVAWFQAAARRAIADVRSRGRTPLLVGGSGLYVRAVVDDLDIPPTDADVRAAVVARVGGDAAAAHRELVARDPAAAARIDPGNLRRSVRALEVLDLTGRRFSAWRTATDAPRSRDPDTVVIGVDVPRSEIDRRVRDRVRAMVDGGLLDEARALSERALSVTARGAIGYAECFAHLAAGSGDHDALVDAIHVRTRRYAVRQQRWFAADPRIRWVDRSAVVDTLVEEATCSS